MHIRLVDCSTAYSITVMTDWLTCYPIRVPLPYINCEQSKQSFPVPVQWWGDGPVDHVLHIHNANGIIRSSGNRGLILDCQIAFVDNH